ncbi:hypothetical protein ACG0Z4_21925 [Enterocloster aldenensis]|uniref:hypothetical protein n=1 Tax=Enterocloster aldenensis TaxID=358742 RepID=UPI004028387F
MGEIGSEFWNVIENKKNREFLLSGRTALEFIIRDILSQKKYESVLMPSYCCHTMIEPFIRHGIKVRFYDIWFDSDVGMCTEIPMFLEKEIFYYMEYFGFSQLNGLNRQEIRKDYPIIIEDRTHSLLRSQKGELADYFYESYRKWSGFYGIASATKKMGGFHPEKKSDTFETYCALRKQASKLKEEYVEFGIGEKSEFLMLYERAEEMLEKDYIGYAPPAECFQQLLDCDFNSIRKERRLNAEILMDSLKTIPEIELIFKGMTDADAPLFVPVYIRNKRNELRKFLIEKQIYCPVHWPLSKYHNGISGRAKDIYNSELSLVCDQRYSRNDMVHIGEAIKTFFKRGSNSNE